VACAGRMAKWAWQGLVTEPGKPGRRCTLTEATNRQSDS
jgi:hypothetical protein